jgi:hypothetical protein
MFQEPSADIRMGQTAINAGVAQSSGNASAHQGHGRGRDVHEEAYVFER